MPIQEGLFIDCSLLKDETISNHQVGHCSQVAGHELHTPSHSKSMIYEQLLPGCRNSWHKTA